ncbi:hypothetical protein FACUT_12258 [Fusarium acutatum]|uniref:Uncharacterized protein n=1 Tax=Fusarium acutatum TaxID=78861 RepID=A0A8H4NJD5_9HYPO|nr:hypothetical protein FACUT_12258 [Fusarium acutatum]
MYEQLALKYPDFANQLEAVSRNHRLSYLDDNNNSLKKVMVAESASGAKRARVEQWKGRRCCVAWTGPDIVQNFLRLRFDNWAIPSESQVKNAIRLLDIDGIWEFPDRWHYEPPSPTVAELEQYLGDEFDSSDNDQDDNQDDDQDDEGDIFRPDTDRIRLRHLVLHEDVDSVNDPRTHARGLAPFVEENPSLQIFRRVSLLDCIIGVSDPTYSLVRSLQRGKRIKLEPMYFRPQLSRKIGYWIRDALVLKHVGVPAKSFTLLLEAGAHQDFRTDPLQRIVHRDVAWHRAYKLLDAHDTFPHDELSSYNIPRWMMRDEDVKAIDELLNRTSEVLSADFHTGVALDAQALAKQTEHLHGFDWLAKWQLLDGSLKQESPPGLIYDWLADVIEFRTDNGHPVTNRQVT